MRQTNCKWRPVDMPIGDWDSEIQDYDQFAEFHDDFFEKAMRRTNPSYAHEVDNIWHGTHSCNDEDWDNDMLNNPAYSWSMFNIHHSD